MIKGVIFDVDGLLLDAEKFQWKGWVEVLKKFGKTVTKEEYYDYAGKSGIFIEKLLIRKHRLKVKKGELLEEKEKLLVKWFGKGKIKLMPYAKEAVRYFKGKYKIAAASSGPRRETLLKLKRGGFGKLFKTVVSSDEVGKIGKPNPAIYLYTAKKMGLKPGECIAFEDTQYGIMAAKGAGMKCIAIPSGFSRKQDFSKADFIFPSLRKAVKGLYAGDMD